MADIIEDVRLLGSVRYTTLPLDSDDVDSSQCGDYLESESNVQQPSHQS